MSQPVLKIYTMTELGFGDYAYYVQTPEDETFYFREKSEARDFISFYHEYMEKKNAKKNSTIIN